MSSINDLGQNITIAVNVLRKTYENVNLLLSELDTIAEEQGFIALTPTFLRWKSDKEVGGWLVTNFIKLYQLNGDTAGIQELPDLREGDVFGVEIELAEDEYPQISLIRYQYDLSQWRWMPTISDHWIFNHPFRVNKQFIIEENDGLWTTKPLDNTKKRYWGIQQAVARSIPLVDVTDAYSIRSRIFKGMLELPEWV